MANAFDPSTLQPSATGRDAITLEDLFSNVPSMKPRDILAGKTQKGDPWGDYLQTMRYLTQPRKDMGPEARRALAGMPSGPKYDEPVELQAAPRGSSLMSLLFGGMK